MAAEPSAEIDFWEFVSCAKCHLPYASEPGKSVPFWLTDCGHVICNNHLNPDQSCASCGSIGILLVPLQQELDAPMSDWFKSIPVALDLMAFTAKFQQEVMARQIRFYRGRHQQIRTVIEKLRADNSDLKRANETLAEENHHLKQQLGYQEPASEIGPEPSYVTNQNGKRLMGVSTYQYDYPSNRPRTGSSPLNASKTPTRLSIPTKQRISEPTQSNEITRQAIPLAVSQRIVNQSNARPMSRQIGKFAYNPPETSHAPTTSLSHLQMAPKLIRPTQSTQGTQSHDLRTSSQTQINDHRNTGLQHTTVQQNRPRNMGPPPVPQARLGTPAVTATGGSRPNNISNRRFVLPQQNQRSQPQPSTSNGPQRFFPKVGQSSSASGSWFNATTSDSGVGSSGATHG